MNKLSPNQVLNKAYKQVPVNAADFERFKNALKTLLHDVSDGQREETQKGHLKNFLSDTFYRSYYMSPEGDIDLAVRLDKTAESNIGLLIEVKSTTNKGEMVSVENLNRKALQELLLYYLRERVTKKNNDIKYLIATNTHEFFIFDAHEFENKFYRDKNLRREFQDFQDGRKTSTKTDFFYTEIASVYIDKVQDSLEYTYFNLCDYVNYLNGGNAVSRKLVELYKILSDTHLLKLSFRGDRNSLDRGFYMELLHIIGIEERKENGKTVIVRKPIERRDEASLLENAINQLDAEDCLRNVGDKKAYGDTRDEQLFSIAMQLCIIWINRILFLKLLEAQMLKYHGGDNDYRFLTRNKIKDFDDLNLLFFQVMARDIPDRTPSVMNDFGHVPYLNSSLFEPTKLEKETIKINSLSQRAKLPMFQDSVLKKDKKNFQEQNRPTLEYLFDFLDSYDFANSGNGEVQENPKTLIDASVLGLIFEKINGHKDGSVFTPGFITMFMCHESISQVVMRKFNDHYGWNCSSITDLYNKIDNIQEANELIDSIKICDPAVGSGHFLVSALNELIRLKFELGVLVDSKGRRIKKSEYALTIENDELIVTDADDNLFVYNPRNEESRRMQETLFNEKRRIIEHCLFGVDINPNSVNICRLRLWIELLKNAYYTVESNYTYLETLPNIDINIKCGNSLLSRFSLDTSIKDVLKESGITIAQYKNAVVKYQNAHKKEEKHEMDSLILNIKNRLNKKISEKTPLWVRLNKKRGELNNSPRLFDLSAKEKKEYEKKINVLKNEITKLEAQWDEFRSNEVYRSAFEWRIEFPQVLDDDGNFIGFDLVIGNPPYIQLQSMKEDSDVLKQRMKYDTYISTGDIYCLFYELGMNIVKNKGCLSYITSNKWMRTDYGKLLRGYFATKTNPLLLIDFEGTKIFDSATVDTNILLLEKTLNAMKTLACKVNGKDALTELGVYMRQNGVECGFDSSGSWVILSPVERGIRRKIEAAGTPLRDWDIKIYRGVLTGCNKAFLIDSSRREEILSNCKSEDERKRTVELIRPILCGQNIKRYGHDWAGLWLINTHNGLNGKLERIHIEDYPAVKKWLDEGGIAYNGKLYKGYAQIQQRSDQGDTPYNLRNCAYLEDFSKPKILFQEMVQESQFYLDSEGKFLCNDTGRIIIGDNLFYLLGILNSKLFFYAVKHFYGGGALGKHGVRMKHTFFQNYPCIPYNFEIEHLAKCLSEDWIESLDSQLNETIYNLYGLTDDEKQTIELEF